MSRKRHRKKAGKKRRPSVARASGTSPRQPAPPSGGARPPAAPRGETGLGGQMSGDSGREAGEHPRLRRGTLTHEERRVPRWVPLVAAGLVVAAVIVFAVWRLTRPQKTAGPAAKTEEVGQLSGGVFTDVTKEAGITFTHTTGQNTHRMLYPEIMGAGMVLFDYDNDGDLDIYFVNGNYIRGKKHDPKISDVLYRNDTRPGGKWRFTDVTEEAGLLESAYGQGGEAADFDNDGDQDLYITNLGPNVYYRNEGNGKFSRTSVMAHDGWGQCAAALDYDNDGDLDLYLVNYLTYDPDKQDLGIEMVAGQLIHEYQGPQVYQGSADVLYRNDGKEVFTDVTREAGVYRPDGKGMGLAVCDFDNDNDPDIFVANDMMVNFLFENPAFGRGKFVERGVEAGVALSADGNPEASMGVDIADVDSDGLFDIMVPCRHRESHTLYHNEWPLFSDASAKRGLDAVTLGYTGFSPNFLDFDNDGDMDLYVSTGEVVTLEEAVKKGLTKPEHFNDRYAQTDLLIENDGRGYFRRVPPEKAGPYFQRRTVARGSAAGDLDNDGDIDLVINISEGRPVLLRNDARGGHWLTLKLVGTKSNRDAIGSRVIARAGGRVQYHYLRGGGSYLSVNDRRIHLGFGEATKADSIEIVWPSGTKQRIENVEPVDRFMTVREPEQT